ncbi:MAG: hypothetical protein N2515_01945, partial [Deltaproteobacteria bacterium]|nr:hypothetical protein [Deltaproteobacteria bacterium]
MRKVQSWHQGVLGLCLALLTAWCGGSPSPTREDGGTKDEGIQPQDTDLLDARPDLTEPRCGNGVLEPGEGCDDGNRRDGDGCSRYCEIECGDGRVTGEESCDIAIPPSLPGACPTECQDSDPCTIDRLVGAQCNRVCEHVPITEAREGDQCCPRGANANQDPDCSPTCGNGVIERGETCENESPTSPCPSSCDDGIACTADRLVGEGCALRCEHEEIISPRNGDGCCPRGATV